MPTTRQPSLDVLSRLLFRARELPRHDSLAIAARWRLEQLLASVDDNTKALAEMLGVTPRQAQRLRLAFDLAGPRPGEVRGPRVAAQAARARKRTRRTRRG